MFNAVLRFPRMRNVPALDGYRGIAILLVMLFHAGVLGFGWAGVQLFYLLSSFLVTTILVSAREKPMGDYFAGFWRRRARRLLPLYFLYLAAIGPFLLPFAPVWASVGLTTLTFNFTQAFAPLDPSPEFGHFWSLAIKAQFYLVWPLCARFLAPRGLRRLAVAMILAAPAARVAGDSLLALVGVGIPPDPAKTFLLPFSHLDALGWGAFFALPSPGRDRGVWAVGISAVALSLACAPFARRSVWTFAAVAFAGAVLFRLALSPGFARLLPSDGYSSRGESPTGCMSGIIS